MSNRKTIKVKKPKEDNYDEIVARRVDFKVSKKKKQQFS